MKPVKIVFGVIALALLMGLVMMIYLAAYLDRHKEVLEATASTALGREVQIEGDIELAWSMTPSIAVRGLSVANAHWASAPRLVHTDEAILQLRLLALLERRLEVRQLTLKGAQLHLEVSEDGLRNWQFGDAQDEGYDLRVERFEVDASQVSYRTPDGAQQRLEIGQLHLRGLGDDRLSLDGDLRYRDAAFVLSGELTADPDTGNATGPFSGELKTDGLALAFAGRTATPFALSHLQLTFTGDAKAFAQTLSRMDLAVPAGASGKLTGQFRTQGASPAEWVDNLNGELALSAAEVVLPGRGKADKLELKDTRLRMAPGKPVTLHTALVYEKQPVTVELTAQPLAQMVSGEGFAQPLMFEAHGRYRDQPVDITSQLGSLETLLGADRKHIRLKKLRAKLGKSDLSGVLKIPLGGPGLIEGNLASTSLDLNPFFAAAPGADTPVEGWLEREWPTRVLSGLSGGFRLEVGRLRVGNLNLHGVKLDAKLEKGGLRLRAGSGRERAGTTIQLKPEGSLWQLNLAHNDKLDIAWMRSKASAGVVYPSVQMNANLKGAGRSIDQVLGSLNGHLILDVGAGQIDEEISSGLPLGDVLFALLGVLDQKGSAQGKTQLECAVAQFEVSKGIAQSNSGLALRTDRLNVLGGGAIDLRTGEIDLRFKTAERKGLGLSVLGVADDFVQLSGPLWDPRAAVNVEGLITHGGAAWATGGLSLLADALVNKLTSFSNPCETVRSSIKK
jgi:hypothetical protein